MRGSRTRVRPSWRWCPALTLLEFLQFQFRLDRSQFQLQYLLVIFVIVVVIILHANVLLAASCTQAAQQIGGGIGSFQGRCLHCFILLATAG